MVALVVILGLAVGLWVVQAIVLRVGAGMSGAKPSLPACFGAIFIADWVNFFLVVGLQIITLLAYKALAPDLAGPLFSESPPAFDALPISLLVVMGLSAIVGILIPLCCHAGAYTEFITDMRTVPAYLIAFVNLILAGAAGAGMVFLSKALAGV